MLRSRFVRMSSRGSEPMERISWRRCTELEEGDRWIAPPPPNRPAWATAAKEARRAKGLKNIMVLVSGGCQTATRTRRPWTLVVRTRSVVSPRCCFAPVLPVVSQSEPKRGYFYCSAFGSVIRQTRSLCKVCMEYHPLEGRQTPLLLGIGCDIDS